MKLLQEVPIISSDAGDPIALRDPSSPASLMKKAKDQEAQSAADMKYDAQAPPRVESFTSCVVEWESQDKTHEILHSLFLAASVVLILYAVAPSQL